MLVKAEVSIEIDEGILDLKESEFFKDTPDPSPEQIECFRHNEANWFVMHWLSWTLDKAADGVFRPRSIRMPDSPEPDITGLIEWD